MRRRNPSPAPPPPDDLPSHEEGRGRRHRHSRMPRSLWVYLFALIGLAAVLFVLFKYLIIPVLVQLA